MNKNEAKVTVNNFSLNRFCTTLILTQAQGLIVIPPWDIRIITYLAAMFWSQNKTRSIMFV